MHRQEYLEIAEIHKLRVNDFVSILNIKDVSKFYNFIGLDSNNYIVTVKENEVICGFAFFTLKTKQFTHEFFFQNNKGIIPGIFLFTRFISMWLKGIFKKQIVFIDPESASLCQLAVRQEYENKGIAKELIKKGELWLKRNSVSEYYLIVNQDNLKAQNLYSNYGFNKKTINGRRIVMVKNL